MSNVSPVIVGWLIVGLTIWALSGRGDRELGSIDFRVRWSAAAVAFVLFSAWSIKADVVPWPWPSRHHALPELLAGGSWNFPVVFWLVQAFLIGMASFCVWRACQRYDA